MARKPLTEEQKQALRDRLAKARAAKVTKQNTNTAGEAPAEKTTEVTPDQPVKETISQDDLSAMLRYIKELEAKSFRNQNQGGPQVQGNKLTGTVEKYSTAKDKYPSPVERLSNEERLQQFAFKINYELDYQVSVSEYTTLDNLRMREPKFTLELNRVMMDEETGQPTNGRYTICRFIMHEDPEAAMVIARANGMLIESDNEEWFLNEMRYLRMRDWLLDCFFPPKPTAATTKKDIVIGGKLVQYFEVNSEQSATIPFGQLTTKL